MTWTVTTLLAPPIAAFFAGLFARELFDGWRTARDAARYDTDAEIYGAYDMSPAPPRLAR